jgi:hypothetical protein
MLDAIARAHPAVLPNVARDHASTEARPAWIRVDRMVGADARQAWVLAASTPWSARDDAADRAELHPRPAVDLAARLTLVTLECTPVDIAMSVIGEAGGVYSPRVLRLWGQGHVRVSLPLRGQTT